MIELMNKIKEHLFEVPNFKKMWYQPERASLVEEHLLYKNLLQQTGVWFSVHQEFFVCKIRTNVWLRFFKNVTNLNAIYEANTEAVLLWVKG